MGTETHQILEELRTLKQEVEYIREHMADKEMFLTPKEKGLLEESKTNEVEGKTLSSQALRRKLDL